MPQMRFDPGDARLISEPETVFGPLRDTNRVCRAVVGGQEVVVLSRHADVSSVLNHPRSLMREPGSTSPKAFGSGPASVLWRHAVSMMDPPDHTRVRRVLTKAFTRRRLDGMHAYVTGIVRDILHRIAADTEIEVVSALSLKVPMRVICEMLGIDEQDWPMLESWTPDVLKIFVPSVNGPQEIAAIHRASQNFLDYFDALIDARRKHPRDDLTTALVAALDQDDGLSRGELVGALRGLLTAGFETTAATISAAVLGFAQQPEQFELLRSGQVAPEDAVEELLRWETPVQMVVRYLGEEIAIGGETLPCGTAMWLLLGAANHDPRCFAEPAKLDLQRKQVEHLAFGGGRHFCLGAHLARIEIRVILQELSRAWSRVELREGKVVRRPHFQFRSVVSLPVSFEIDRSTTH